MGECYHNHIRAAFLVFAAIVMAAVPIAAQSSTDNNYTRTNLVSDIAGVADIADPNLVNPWGLVQLPCGNFQVVDN